MHYDFKLELSSRHDFTVAAGFESLDLRAPKGRIDRFEIQDYVRDYIGATLTSADLDAIIRRTDVDGDETVSYSEFSDAVHSPGLAEPGHSAAVREAELRASLRAEAEARATILARERAEAAERAAAERRAIEAEAEATRLANIRAEAEASRLRTIRDAELRASIREAELRDSIRRSRLYDPLDRYWDPYLKRYRYAPLYASPSRRYYESPVRRSTVGSPIRASPTRYYSPVRPSTSYVSPKKTRASPYRSPARRTGRSPFRNTSPSRF